MYDPKNYSYHFMIYKSLMAPCLRKGTMETAMRLPDLKNTKTDCFMMSFYLERKWFSDAMVGKNLEASRFPASPELKREAEKLTGVTFGPQLTNYVRSCGYLAYMHRELLGLVENMGEKSDLISITKGLRLIDKDNKLSSLIAIDDHGDGYYAMVDSDDIVHFYDTNSHDLECQGYKLFDYIQEQFNLAEAASAE